MRFRFLLLVAAMGVLTLSQNVAVVQEAPLRVFIRSGAKTHGPGAHDHPRFLKEWVPLLNSRGARATGADAFPTKAQLDDTDVLILHAQEAGNITDREQRANLEAFLARGGGLVVIHAGAVSHDPDWFKGLAGGSWRQGVTQWLEGPMHLYFTGHHSPITRDVSNWAMDDEIYYDMDLAPQVQVLAAAYTPKPAGARNAQFERRADELTGGGKHVSVFDVQPQMWTYERTMDGGRKPYRAFVSLPGHLYENFTRPAYQAILLRAVAWAGQRTDVDTFLKEEERGDALRYVRDGPTHPSKATERLEIHPDFNLSLVAAEPLIRKVIALDWDERGRLWVAETPEYPNGRRPPNVDLWKDSGSLKRMQVDREPEDSIAILQDSNGDGVMDRKHVFADKLELVTGFVFYRNGVIAASAPDIWYLEDTNGDEVVDRRTKLYSGLGTFDTHAVINNLRWGLDGWIYATHGYSTGTVTSGDGGKTIGRANSGVVRFKPDGGAFEQYSSRGGNTWGLDITWDGQVFWTQPTSGTVFFHTVLPEYVLAQGRIPNTPSYKGMIAGQKTYPATTWKEQAYAQIDLVGQFTAAAGCAVYDGGAWPDRWRYSYFTTEPTINLVHHQFVKPDGVSYTTSKEQGREETEFIRSRDLWFRPIETRVGPDGALYVVDFYNQAVIHNDTRGPQHGPANAAVRPDRDHGFGRIYRIQHKEAKRLEVPALDRANLDGLIRAMETSPNAHVKMQAWRLARENHASSPRLQQIARPMGSQALAVYERARAANSAAERKAQLDIFARATDDWTRSAIIAAATRHEGAYVAEAFTHEQPQALAALVEAIVPAALPQSAAQLLIAAGGAGTRADALAVPVVRAVAVTPGESPAANPTVINALQALLENPATTAAVLPVIARWDKAGALRTAAERQATRLARELSSPTTSDERRAAIGASLLELPAHRPAALAAVAALLAEPKTSDALKERLIATLGGATGRDVDAALVGALARASSPQLFDLILKRPSASRALLESIAARKTRVEDLGPANVARLRTHPDKAVATRATAVFETLMPVTKAKGELITKLLPAIAQPGGDAARGKQLFTGTCASCHRLGDVGQSALGPPLTGMGTHGRAELLAQILDPNREVNPSYWQWDITTKKGETLAGVLARENQAGITLRTLGGDVEIKKEEIVTRENTRRSMMPEGFEALGAETLRDILAFIEADSRDTGFRVVDLREAYTADSRRGLRVEDERDDTVGLHRFGNVTVAGVPFFLMDPARSPRGTNIVAVRAGAPGGTLLDQLPRSVEIPVSATASSLHFLGGVARGAWPTGGDAARGKPVLKVTAHFADGRTEAHVLENGRHFAELGSTAAVPLSQPAGDFTRRGQLRYFTVNLKAKGPLSKVVLEAIDGEVVPCTVALTVGAEPAAAASASAQASGAQAAGAQVPGAPGPKEGGKGDAPLPETKPITWAAGKTKVLIVGGGSSHDFGRHFGETDGATLRAAGFDVHYTEDRDQAATELRHADVAVISVNRQFFDTPAWRTAVMEAAKSGKGLVMLHPGTWYGFAGWPELNATIVGGGSRGHDKLGPFSVTVVKPEHPVVRDVPRTFEVVDELYYINAEAEKIPAGTAAIEVLAETSPSERFKKPHPAVWITRHPTARVVGITLGHDGRVHEHAAFKTLLVNAVRWAGQPAR